MGRNKIPYESMSYNKYINFFIFRQHGHRQGGDVDPSRLHFGMYLDWGLGLHPGHGGARDYYIIFHILEILVHTSYNNLLLLGFYDY